MPKRASTPPPGDDEPRYLTVVHPYPLYADMERENDRIAFVFWMATCIGRENLYAFFHKPKSPNMVIIEVNRFYKAFNGVLGEHRWSEVLRDPSHEEKTRVSKVFYCTYTTGREVEKYGWKRVFIRDSWYETAEMNPKWVKVNNIIKYPYPSTYRCEVPPEDQTREPLCRPLPVRAFPPPPPTRPPTVGTPEWVKAKQAEASLPRVKTAGKARTKGAPKLVQDDELATERSEGLGVSKGVINMGSWARGPSLPPGVTFTPSPSVPAFSPTPSITSHSSASSASAHQAPPGLQRNLSPAFINDQMNGNDVSRHTVPQDGNVGNNGSAIDEHCIDDLYADGPDAWAAPAAEAVVPELAPDTHPWAVLEATQASFGDPVYSSEAQAEQTNLWAEVETEVRPAPEWFCKIHKEKCKPKMCMDYAAWFSQKQRQKREEDRATAAAEKNVKGKSKKSKTWENNWKRNGSRASENTMSTDGSKSPETSNRSDKSTVPPKLARLASRLSISPSPNDPDQTASNSGEDSGLSTPNSTIGERPVPPRPARLNSSRQTPGSPNENLSRTKSSGSRPIPPKPARLNKKQPSSSSNKGTPTTPSTSTNETATPPRPARLNGRPANGSLTTAPRSPANNLPAKSPRLNGNRNGTDSSNIAVSPYLRRKTSTVPSSLNGNASMNGRDPGSSLRTANSIGAHSAGPSADPWDLGYRPALRKALEDDAHSVAPSTTSGWGNVSEDPWGDGDGGNDVEESGARTPQKRSWADEMDDEDTQSVAETDGWGSVSVGPW